MAKPASFLRAYAAACVALLKLFCITLISASAWLAATGETRADANRIEHTSFIRPLARDRAYRILVIGDSVGANLADGLKWTFRRGENVVVRKRTKAGTGFVRTDVYDWQRVIRRLSRKSKADIIVMLIGGNDRQDMRVRGRRYERFSAKWRQEYIKRLDKAARKLNKSGAAIYWIGLPNVRSRRMSRDYVRFNSYFKRVSERYNIKYIDIRQLFETRSGGYSDYGKDLRGRRVRLRDRDGIHMSNSGSKVLGRFVGGHILKDMPRNDTVSSSETHQGKYVRKKVAQQ